MSGKSCSGVDGVNGTERSGSVVNSAGIDPNSLASGVIASGLENAPGELGDEFPMANFHTPSKIVLHENGIVEKDSATEGAGTSVSGRTAGLVGEFPRIESLDPATTCAHAESELST
jgi:hypothetical protein